MTSFSRPQLFGLFASFCLNNGATLFLQKLHSCLQPCIDTRRCDFWFIKPILSVNQLSPSSIISAVNIHTCCFSGREATIGTLQQENLSRVQLHSEEIRDWGIKTVLFSMCRSPERKCLMIPAGRCLYECMWSYISCWCCGFTMICLKTRWYVCVTSQGSSVAWSTLKNQICSLFFIHFGLKLVTSGHTLTAGMFSLL